MKLLSILTFAGLAFSLAGTEQEFLENPPYAYNGIFVGRSAETERTPDGEAAFEVTARYGSADLAWPSQLRYNVSAEKLRGVERGVLEFWTKGPAGRSLRLVLNSEDFAGDETIRYTKPGVFKMTGEWQKIVWPFEITCAVTGHYADMPRYALLNTIAGDKFLLGPVVLKVVSRKNFPGEPKAEVPAGWRALPESGLYIEPGSALDFRKFADRRPAGSLGRLIVNAQGKLAFERDPQKEVRFFSVQGFPTMMTKPELKAYAAAVARQGFNMIRLHFLDAYLNCGKREKPFLKKGVKNVMALPQEEVEIEFDPIALDRIFYLIACLKAEGVYLNLDLQSSFYGYRNGTAPNGYPGDESAKLQLFVNEGFRKNFAAGTRKLLNTVNPYTGLALKDDPAAAMLCFYNEQDILLGFRNYGKAFHAAYVKFLKNKFGTVEALNRAWGTAVKSFEEVRKFGSLPRNDRSAQTAAMTEFAAQMQLEMDEFYRKVAREAGWRGLCSNWNMRPYLCSVPARAGLDLVMLNFYFAHPVRESGGVMRVSQGSSLASGGAAFAPSTTVRFLDRPFVISEFGHVFWNRYRHEMGLLWGAGAALQGWSGLTQHADNVVPYMKRITPFAVGFDPVTRAGEQIAMLAFLRGDVKEASAAIEYEMKPEFLFSRTVNNGLSSEYYQLWPLVKLGISYGEKAHRTEPVLRVAPSRTGQVGGGLLYTENETASSRDISEAIVSELRRKGVLSAANRTDLSRGRFESCTGEIFVTKERGGEMSVSAPRLCGIVKKDSSPEKAGALALKSATVPVAVAAASLDESPLAESRRVLLFVLTDARNSNMKFLDKEETRLKDTGRGTLPLLIRTGKFEIELDRAEKAETVECYALDLSGKRVGKVPVQAENGRWILSLDTAKTPIPATTYELIAAR